MDEDESISKEPAKIAADLLVKQNEDTIKLLVKQNEDAIKLLVKQNKTL